MITKIAYSLLLFSTFSILPCMEWAKDWYGTTPLMTAARSADIQQMEKLIAAGADVNEVRNRDFPHAGNCALSEAIESGSLEAVRLLIGAGANVNELVESGLKSNTQKDMDIVRNLSLLSHAIHIKAPITIIQELIKSGAQIDDSKNLVDWTALMVATYVGYFEAVKLLLDAGADVSIVSETGKTALEIATEEGHEKIKELLIQYGALAE